MPRPARYTMNAMNAMNTIVPLVGPQGFRRLLTLGVLLASLPVRALDAGAPGLLPAPAQPQVVPDRAAAERAKHAEEALKRSEAEKQRLAAEKQRLAAEKQRLENALAESERRPPRVVEKLVEKPVPDSGAAKRAAQSERAKRSNSARSLRSCARSWLGRARTRHRRRGRRLLRQLLPQRRRLSSAQRRAHRRRSPRRWRRAMRRRRAGGMGHGYRVAVLRRTLEGRRCA